MKTTIDKQKDFFDSGVSKNFSFRKDNLKSLYNAIEQNEKRIKDSLFADLGKSAGESYLTEIFILKNEIKHMISNLKNWMKPEKVSSDISLFPSKAKIYKEPLGLALIISPWNYPVQLSFTPLAAAIGAGCCSIIKPSEYSPNCSQVIKEIVSSCFDENYVSVVLGGKEVSQDLLKEKFDVIFFTGNSQVGKEVMKAAAENLTPVILELGGKSPCIVDESANIKLAAKRIMWGKLLNAGQTCVAPDYLLVHEAIKDKLINELKQAVETFYGSNPLENIDYPKIISKRHFQRAIKLLDNEKIIHGGKYNQQTLKIEPTIIDNVDFSSPVMNEEIFAPILPILTFQSLCQGLKMIKSLPKPLAVYLFSNVKEHKDKVISELTYGGGCINDTITHLMPCSLPFGGVGISGMGKYHGKAGFDAFSNSKSILEKSLFLDIPLRYPPFKDKMKYLKIFSKISGLFK